MSPRGRHTREAHSAKPSIFGDGLPERLRSTSFALLGITTAAGLVLVGLVFHQGWSVMPNLPIPGAPPQHGAVQERTVVAEAAAPEQADGRPSAGEANTPQPPAEPRTAARTHSRLAAADQVTVRSLPAPEPAPNSVPPSGEEPSAAQPPAPQPVSPPPVEPSPASQPTPAPINPSPPAASSLDESDDGDEEDDEDEDKSDEDEDKSDQGKSDEDEADEDKERGRGRSKGGGKYKAPPPAETDDGNAPEPPDPVSDTDEDEVDEDESEIEDQQDHGRGRSHWRRGR